MTYEVLEEFVQDSDEWHAQRAEGVGASDVAAILGLSPWQTPLSIYMNKKGVRSDIDEDLAFFGNALEEPITKWLNEKHPEIGEVEAGMSVRSKDYPWLTAKPDRIIWVEGDEGLQPIPVELKTSSAYSRESWADGVPVYYLAQVQQQIMILDAPYGYLAVLHGGNRPEKYLVQRDQKFIDDHLIPKIKEFWFEHVLKDVPPEPVTSAEAQQIWPGDLEETIEGSEELYDLWGAYGLMQAEAVDVQERLDGIKLELQKVMKDAVALTYQGRELFTWRPRAGAKRLDMKALGAAHPELVAEFTKQGAQTRTFLRKKEKE